MVAIKLFSLQFDTSIDDLLVRFSVSFLLHTIIFVNCLHGFYQDFSSSNVFSAAALGTWYTNAYRASIYPRMLFELDANGENPVHYSPSDAQGRTFPGVLSSDSGFWDAYRTVYPLTSLIRADQMRVQMDGWMHAYLEGGHLPSWASPGDRGAIQDDAARFAHHAHRQLLRQGGLLPDRV